MDQCTARLLAKYLYARDPGLLPIAMTEAHQRGQWDKPNELWIVVTTTEMIYREVPNDINLDELIVELGD